MSDKNLLDYKIAKYNLGSEMVKYCQKLDAKGFGANHDGNITAKCGDVLLTTPTAVSKGNIISDILIVLDMQGNKIEGVGKPFSEIKLHLAAYRTRGEAMSVVHAHPPFATARGLLNLPLKPALPEAVVSLGDIVPVVPFSMPGTSENEKAVSDALSAVDVVMICGNGVLAIGDSIEQAYLRLELVEHLAKIDYYARAMGGVPQELNQEDIAALLKKRAAAGLGPQCKKTVNAEIRENISSSPSSKSTSQLDAVRALIAEELKKVLA